MPLPKQLRRRRLLSLIIATIFGVLGTTTLSVGWMWHVMMADDVVQGTSPVKVSATSILKSEATSRTITAMFGSPVRVVWLRAFDWQEKRGVRSIPQPDPQRFRFVPDPARQTTEVIEPGAGFDGGGKDMEIAGVGTWFDRHGAFSVWGLDTSEGSERELVTVGRLFNPLIAPDGQTVIYTRETENHDGTTQFRVHQIAWDGTGDHELAQGYGLWVNDEPDSGERWLYGTDRFDALWRISLTTPDRRQVLYRGALSPRLSLAADGRTACGEFPWPHVGVLDVTSGVVDYRGLRDGCNASMAPDGSGMISLLNGAHTAVTIFDEQRTAVEVDLIPPQMKKTTTGQRGKIWSPKWAADSRHVILSGPIRAQTADAADIWLGEYAADRSSVVTWVQVTTSDSFDVCPFLWRKSLSSQRLPNASSTSSPSSTSSIPVVRRVQVLGLDQVAVTFDRPMAPASLRLVTDRGDSATTVSQGTSERVILATFPSFLSHKGQLQIIIPTTTDLSVSLTADFKVTSWPAWREGLLARWVGRAGDNTLSLNGSMVTTTIVPSGFARFDRDGSVLMQGGRYVATALAVGESSSTSTASGLGVELGFRLLGRDDNVTTNVRTNATTKATLADLSSCFEGPGQVMIQEQNGRLTLLVGDSSSSFSIGTISDQLPHSLSVVFRQGELTAYVDGILSIQQVTTQPLTLAGKSAAKPSRVTGDGVRAHLLAIALFDGRTNPEQAAISHRALCAAWDQRPKVRRISVRVQLLGRSRIPQLSEIQPYRSALVVNSYRVIRGSGEQGELSGALVAGTNIFVAEWALMDSMPTELGAHKPDQERELNLGLFSEHPELESVYFEDTLDHPATDMIYVDIDR